MKKITILFALTFFTSYSTFSQTSDENNISYLFTGGGHNFQIIGEESGNMIDSLFAKNRNTKRKGYVWKFKRIQIPGLDYTVTFQVHQGLAGKEGDCRGYFNTFTSEKYKTERLAQKKDAEKPAIIIYVKQRRNHVLKTEEDAKVVKEYLLSMYQG